jgi:tetratricopeptide (TPR) repeat protein
MSFRIERSEAAPKQPGRSLPRSRIVFVPILVLVSACGVAEAQVATPTPSPSNPEIDSGEIRTLSVETTADQVQLRNAQNGRVTAPQSPAKDDTCLLPPLNEALPSISAVQLQTPAAARKEYQKACSALKDKKIADAEKHLRKAVREYPKYAAAWITLGQVLAAQQRTDEARGACLQGSTVDSSYVPAYLCLADIAARAHAWDEVLKLSGRVLELDPAHNAVAYEYHAAANLNLHNLAEAEKSGLRAVEIDKDHHEPRVHFVLAQIYEAKGDSANEGAQLREYLKYADSPDDIALVKQFLSRLEQQSGKSAPLNYLPLASSRRIWEPGGIDEVVPPVRTDTTCPLPQILKETSKRTEDLIDDLQRFSASERIEQIDIGKNGKRRNSASEVVNYVAQIEQNSGYPRVEEYRSRTNGIPQAAVVDTGSAAFALIFHPTQLGNFDFHCEGLSDLQASPSWQLHFEERSDPSKAFQALRIGGALYLPRLKGRAWIATDSYAVLRIETDLVSPIPQIDLQMEHLVIVYAPVDFQKGHVRLWLPASASLYLTYRGRRYERVHNYSQFQLFSVDSAQAIKEPIASGDENPQ